MDWIPWLSSAIGLAGLSFAIFAYRANRKRKLLTYATEVDQEIGAPARYGHWGDLAVTLGNDRIEWPRILTVTVTNSGQVEVRPEDFSAPLSVSCTKEDTLVSAKVIFGTKELEPVAVTPTKVAAPPVLLNRGEYLSFYLLIDGVSGDIEVDAHVAGAEIRQRDSQPRKRDISRSWQQKSFVWLIMILATAAMIDVTAGVFKPAQLPTDNRVTVPDVRLKPTLEAINSITNAGLTVGDIETVDNTGKMASGTILTEYPKPGTLVPKGIGVVLTAVR